MANDITGLPAFEAFDEIGKPIWDRERVVLVPDHYVPAKDVKSAGQAKAMRLFASRNGIKNYFEVGNNGVCHQVMLEQGFVAPGRVIVGADSHTCSYGALGAFSAGIGSTEAAVVFASGKLWFKVPETFSFKIDGGLKPNCMGKDLMLKIIGDVSVSGCLYRSMEFSGKAIDSISLADRFSMCNMVIEAGGKCGFMPPDRKVDGYLKGRVVGGYSKVYPTEPNYEKELHYDASEIVPLVAAPHSPDNVKPAAEADVKIDQAYLGSCTNGRIEDLRIAAKVLKGKKVHSGVRLIVVPASKGVYGQALAEGLLKIFLDSGAFISGWTCGACLGGHMGVLAEGEVCISSTNRNFIGRMGHPKSSVYLASPATVAASAVAGRISEAEL